MEGIGVDKCLMFPQPGGVFHHPSTRPFISSVSSVFGGSVLEELSRQKLPDDGCFEAAEADPRASPVTSEYQSCAEWLPPLEMKPQFRSFSALVGTFSEEPPGFLMLGPASTHGQAGHRNGFLETQKR